MTSKILGIIVQGEYPACEVLESSYFHENENPLDVAIRYYGYHRAQMRDYLAIMFITPGSAVVYSRCEILSAEQKNLTAVLTSAETETSRKVVPEAGIEPATKGL